MARVRVAVVGGGIAGLAAAHRLRELAGAAVAVDVYEAGPAPGGKLRSGRLAGHPVEYGAEAFLARDPVTGDDSAAVALARAVDPGTALRHPATARAAIAADGALHPVPAGTLVGVPGDPAALPPLTAASAEPPGDRPLLGPAQDVSVGALVRARLGAGVLDRLVDPMLGGVYAGRADDLSLAVTMPALARACRTESTLAGAVRAAVAALPRRPGAPVFAAPAGGMTRLVGALAAAGGAALHCGRTVRALDRTAAGWRLTIGPTADPAYAEADAVVLAVPARPAARLLTAAAPLAADLIGALDYASIALVTLALPAGTPLPDLSGLLVAGPGAVKAATFFGRKWGHPADVPVLLRASLGRYGEEAVLQADDHALVATARADLAALLGARLPEPLAAHVQRWGGALPQYRPGHLDRVAAARAALPPGLALAGAACDGIGIPACVASGRRAADDLRPILASGELRD
ncbi:protoporphyrinogen oxidase [Pilimelia anulata]|uniref:Coproporphyrinogen III oxidase n=1 Tax=Pilimelia anulata TaxID=53371 RepID=A0A8J3B6Y2_9ACTN|nr:protoporphyrinogen oxidase [Pilimelia anulata]GGJ78008.1 protoporphyrinogen oxidase [Pilimelia anulata]